MHLDIERVDDLGDDQLNDNDNNNNYGDGDKSTLTLRGLMTWGTIN